MEEKTLIDKKKRILSMSKEELLEEKHSAYPKSGNYSSCSFCSGCSGCSYCFNCTECSDCSECSYCYSCSDCSYCSDCYYCKNQTNKKYMIANVQFTKKEYEEWKKKH